MTSEHPSPPDPLADHLADPWPQWQSDCRHLGVAVDEAGLLQFQQLYARLVEANRTTNLTRITALEDFLYRHLLDSLTLAAFLPENARLMDVGSGAGFPALPLALVRPDVQVIAVDSVGKKCRFMAETGEALGLKRLRVLHARSEDLGRDAKYRQTFDVVTARAVAVLPVLLEQCLPLVKVGGRFLAMKGLSYETEVAAAANALKVLGGALTAVKTFDHPRLSGSRLLIVEKRFRCQDAYPRAAGLAAKNPL